MGWLLLSCASFLLLVSGELTKEAAKEAAGELLVTAALPGGGAALAGALAELAAAALRAGGLRARAVPPPAACAPPARADSPACRDAVAAALARARLHAALLAAPAARAPATWALRDAGLDELGDVAPPPRRSCLAPPPARSLLDLADPALAALYALPNDTAAREHWQSELAPFVPDWCSASAKPCAALLTSDAGEARVLAGVVRTHRLRAVVMPCGNRLRATDGSGPHVICDWAPDISALASPDYVPLGPPPCQEDVEDDECAFESRRLVKLVNARALARSPSAVRALLRLRLSAGELRELAESAQRGAPADAARRFMTAHPARAPTRELRAAVLLPATTRRQAYDAPALAAAAALAEADLQQDWSGDVKFKVETYDDQCSATRAYQYLLDALGTGEYGALSAAAGPACGAAFADAARQGPAHGLPALAYSAQPPPAAARALLAAGDARAPAAVLAALAGRLRWRRVATLTETAARAPLAVATRGTDLIAHLELPADAADYDPNIFTEWAERAAAARARVFLVLVEDARAARAALCAGRAAGLTAGAWLLPAGLPRGWLHPAPNERCSALQLQEAATGHLSVAFDWMLPWLDDVVTPDNSSADSTSPGEQWRARWAQQCSWVMGGAGACATPGPLAPLLYDALRLWAAALGHARALRPSALDDLHDATFVKSLLKNATNQEFEGVTGKFKWESVSEESEGTVYARTSPLVLLQWNEGARRVVGRWADGLLMLDERALQWRTVDGRAPDDGGDDCALRPLAKLLRADCRTAFIVLGVALLALVGAALAGTAVYCRRRAERQYRARLEALGLHSLPKSAGLDRWELPREQVVINRKLGMGAFGTVYGGHALLVEGGNWTAVAVKTLKAGASTEEKLDFLSEAEAMKRFDHENVVRLLGVVTKMEPVCTVMEFMLHGDLKSYLLARRHLAAPGARAGAAEAAQVSAARLTGMARDAARALAYLARLRYVHRDVAARNCLVSSSYVVKLADFGMTRLVFENDYYRFSRKGMLPVRWMAPESLALGVFSSASDVWSFGVLLYEIVTFGSLPFQGLSNSEVLERVKCGRTLELPPGIKPQLEALITWCWQQEAGVRPAASELAARLAEAPRLLAPCLDVPLDALPLHAAPPWHLPPERAEARWLSWAAPASAATDTTYLSAASADATQRELEPFLP